MDFAKETGNKINRKKKTLILITIYKLEFYSFRYMKLLILFYQRINHTKQIDAGIYLTKSYSFFINTEKFYSPNFSKCKKYPYYKKTII